MTLRTTAARSKHDAVMGRFWSVIELALKLIDDAPVRAILANAEAKGGA